VYTVTAFQLLGAKISIFVIYSSFILYNIIMKLYQDILNQAKSAASRKMGIIDNSGIIIACSDMSQIGESRYDIVELFEQADDISVLAYKGNVYRPLPAPGSQFVNIAFVEGDDEYAHVISNMLDIALCSAKLSYDEKYDRATFVKNITLDLVPSGEISARARELQMNNGQTRAVLLIRQIERYDSAAIDILLSLFPEHDNDFVIALENGDIVLIKEVQEGISGEGLHKLAKGIADTLNTELYLRLVIGISTPSNNLRELSASYKEAIAAIDVNKVFDNEQNIIYYGNLGIGRLIYRLPAKLCQTFLNELNKSGAIDTIDEETMRTIQMFFELNLSISETARKLFIHRNTLVYRIEKLKRITGLDVRNLDDAIVFKVAHMVKKYLKSQGK